MTLSTIWDETMTQNESVRRNGRLPSRCFHRLCRRLVLVAGLMSLTVATGCVEADPGERNTCRSEADCAEGHFCRSDGVCIQNCDPDPDANQDAGQPVCGDGEVCSPNGRCVAGECATDSDCTDPPPPTCTSGKRKEFSESGECVQQEQGAVCQYVSTTSTCEFGCADGSCQPSPCVAKTCDDPPPSTCSEDGESRITYASPGTCDDATGECSYESFRDACAFGCQEAVCLSGPCEATTCDDPPEAECDVDTKVSWGADGTCLKEGDQAICDYPRNERDCRYVDANCANGQCIGAVAQTGDVVITEFMANPAPREDSTGEWLEVYNTTGGSIDLQDWTLKSGATESHTIDSEVTVPADGRAILGVSSDPAGNGDVTPDYVYNSVFLANDSDSLRLVDTSGAVSDFVFYEEGSILEGRSRMLDPSVDITASANDEFDHWCPAMATATPLGADDAQRGTPAQSNAECAVTPCEQWTCQQPQPYCQDGVATRATKPQAECTKNDFNNPTCDFGVQSFACESNEFCTEGVCYDVSKKAPDKGDLVITEMMGNPYGSDEKREWIEIYNVAGRDIPLYNLIIKDNESGSESDSFTVTTTQAKIRPGEYVVFARNTNTNQNDGLPGDSLSYDGSHLKNTPGQSMDIRIVGQNGTIIDSARYLQPTEGASQQFDASTYLNVANPAQENGSSDHWCDATSAYGNGSPANKGTPGAKNDSCGGT